MDRAKPNTIGRVDRTHLVRQTALRTGFTQQDVTVMVNAFLDAMIEELENGHGVIIKDLGRFEVRDRNAVMARDPRNGDPIHVPARKKLLFKTCVGIRKKLAELAP